MFINAHSQNISLKHIKITKSLHFTILLRGLLCLFNINLFSLCTSTHNHLDTCSTIAIRASRLLLRGDGLLWHRVIWGLSFIITGIGIISFNFLKERWVSCYFFHIIILDSYHRTFLFDDMVGFRCKVLIIYSTLVVSPVHHLLFQNFCLLRFFLFLHNTIFSPFLTISSLNFTVRFTWYNLRYPGLECSS